MSVFAKIAKIITRMADNMTLCSYEHWWYLNLTKESIPLYTNHWVFPKVDNLGIDDRIVLEQNNFSKKKTTSDRTWIPDHTMVCGVHFFTSVLVPYVLVPNDPYIVMLYWFLVLEEVIGFSWNQ